MAKMDLSKYTDQQLDAAHMLANKDANGLSNSQIADTVGLSERTLYRWLSTDDEFIELLNHFAELSMEAFTPELYNQLKKAVRTGSTRAMELVLKNRGKLIDKKEVSGNIDVNALNGGLSQDAILADIEDLKRKIANANVPQLKEADEI